MSKPPRDFWPDSGMPWAWSPEGAPSDASPKRIQMKITLAHGFFLPVPALAGGSTEKVWHRLALEFARRGHEVTIISKAWPGLADSEQAEGITYRRLPGFAHRRSLPVNLLLDFLWSWRVYRALPTADVVVTHTLALPLWLRLLKPAAGSVVVMAGRMPRGQYRWYRRISRVLVPSAAVEERLLRENPSLRPKMKITGYPIDWQMLSNIPANRESDSADAAPLPLTIGFVGRINREKGLELLAKALSLVARDRDLPPWRLALCGPSDIARGGSGPEFVTALRDQLARDVGATRFELMEPVFDERALAEVYQQFDIFCYPSLAAQGETFGVAVAEAMAAGAVPVVSGLACFRDLVRPAANGLVFDHEAADPAAELATAIVRLLRNPGERRSFAAAAREDARRFDFSVFAEQLLADFAGLEDRQ